MRLRGIITALAAVIAILPLTARRTTRPGLRPGPVEQGSAAGDSLEAASTECVSGNQAPVVVLAGYDKPLQSRRESFFATNTDSLRSVEYLWLTATYYAMDGRMLHRRPICVQTTIPPLETRMLSTQSWDRQGSFYYHLSRPPERTPGIPYRLTLSIDSMLVSRPSQ